MVLVDNIVLLFDGNNKRDEEDKNYNKCTYIVSNFSEFNHVLYNDNYH